MQLQYYVKHENCKVNDVIFPSGCEARAINLGNKNMTIGIFSGGTSVRSKNIFTNISRYPTGNHEIIHVSYITDVRQLESHLESIRQRHLEVRDPLINDLRKLTDTFEQSAEQMKSHVLATIQSQLNTELQKSFAR